MYKSGKSTVIAMKDKNIGINTGHLNELSVDPIKQENRRARRRMKKTLMLVKWQTSSLNGWTVMKRMATKVRVMATTGKTIAFSRKAAANMMQKRETKKREANHRQSQVPGCVPSLKLP
jgi:hypothetical protein